MEEKTETVVTTVEGIKPVRLRNVLFATDFSAASERALNYALAIARRYESPLYVAHVIRPELYQALPPDPFVPTLELSRPLQSRKWQTC